MYKVIDGQICTLTVVDKKIVDTKVHSIVARVANFDNQLRTILEQKERILAELKDLEEVIPALYPEEAQMLGMK